MNIQIPKWMQMIGLPILILLIWFAASMVTTALFIFITATVISLMLNPLVVHLESIRIPRYIGVFLVYILLIAIIVLLFILIIPPAVNQLTRLIDNLPSYGDSLRSFGDDIRSWLEHLNLPFDVTTQLSNISDRISTALVDLGPIILAYSVDLVSGLTQFLLIIVISIYMLLDARRLGNVVRGFFPPNGKKDANEFISRMQKAVTHWFMAQALLSFLIGLSVGIGMWLLGVTGFWPQGSSYAVFFGAWAGLTEFIPYLGPILGALPPMIASVFNSPWSLLAVVAVFIFIQEVEAHILVPNIMGTVVGVHPLVVIFAMLAGAEIRGIFGILLALPLVALGRELVLFARPRLSLEKWDGPSPPLLEETERKVE